jgi:hypothetical protein
LRVGGAPSAPSESEAMKSVVSKLPLSRFAAASVAAIAMLAFAAAFSPVAMAADPTTAQYCDGLTGGGSGSSGGSGIDCGEQGTGGQQESGGSGGGTDPGSTPVSTSSGGGLGGQVGQLPFTGWDLLSMLAIAVALTTSGLALARVTRRGARS